MSALSASFSVNTINDSDDEEMMKQARGSGQWSGLATIHNEKKPGSSGNDHACIMIGSWNMAQPVVPPQDSQMEDAQDSLEDPYFDMGDAEGEAMKGENGKSTELEKVDPLNDATASPKAEHGGALVGTEALKEDAYPKGASSISPPLGGSSNRKVAPILAPVVQTEVAGPKVASIFATPPLKRSLVVEFQSPNSKSPDSTNQDAAGSEENEEDKKRKLLNDPKFAKGTKMGDLSPASQDTLKKVRRWRAVENSNRWHSTYSSKGVKKTDQDQEGAKGHAVDEGEEGHECQEGHAVAEGQEGHAVEGEGQEGHAVEGEGQEGHAVEGEGDQPKAESLSMQKILQTENVEDLKRINLVHCPCFLVQSSVQSLVGFCQKMIAFEVSTLFESFKNRRFVPQCFFPQGQFLSEFLKGHTGADSAARMKQASQAWMESEVRARILEARKGNK